MIYRATRLKLRRNFRRQKKQVIELSVQAEDTIERHFFKRLTNLGVVWRFLFGWITLLTLMAFVTIGQTRGLNSAYQELRYVNGGIYTEGMVGSYTNANPIFAVSAVDRSVSKLVFGGLFKHDDSGALVPDMAKSWQVDEKGSTFTVALRDDVYFHDGLQMTSKDVAYTVSLIQNPDTKSPYRSSWQDITVTMKDKFTVVFTLPNALAAFPQSLTLGIVPQHILSKFQPLQLRSELFNTTAPVGAGAYRFSTLGTKGDTVDTRTQTVGLTAYEKYHLGPPAIAQFVIKTYRNEESLLKDYNDGALTAVAGLDTAPKNRDDDVDAVTHTIRTTNATFLFLRTTSEVLKDTKVRQALVRATDQKELVKDFGYVVSLLDEPILPHQTGYNKSLAQFTLDRDAANKLLDEAGWVRNKEGVRMKDGKKLELIYASQDSVEYRKVTDALIRQWQQVGVTLTGTQTLRSADDMQTVISDRVYDVLLYGITVGGDPDVFAYWHSTQADPRSQGRLNLSEYKSANADKALESGRTRLDSTLRAVKYKPFLESWRADVPAIALYQPLYIYTVRGVSQDFNPHVLVEDTDRYNNVHNWHIAKAHVDIADKQ